MITTETKLSRVFARMLPVNIAVQALSFGAWVAFAHVLGATTATDAYLLGLSVPFLAYGILLAGIRVGAIPGLTQETSKGAAAEARAANELVAASLVASAAIAFVVTIIAIAGAPLVLRPDPSLLSQTRLIIVELSPLAVLGAMTGVLSAILAVRKSFAPAVAVMAFDPIFRIFLVLVLGGSLGVQALVIANLVGGAAAVVALWLQIGRTGKPLRLVRPVPTAFVRAVFGVSTPLLVSASVLTVNPIIDRTMAGGLSTGAVTALDLGLRLVPSGIFVALVVAPLTATWSARQAEGGWPAIQESMHRALTTAAIVILPLIVIGFILRRQAVVFAYHGGAYSPHAAADTSAVFGMAVLGLAPLVLSVIFSTLFIVQRETLVPMKIGFINVVLNVGLNFALRSPFGVAGIALSTTLTYGILNVVQATAARRRWGSFIPPAAVGLLLRIGASLALGAIAVEGVLRVLPPAGSRLQALMILVLAGGAGLAVYAAAVFVGRGFLVQPSKLSIDLPSRMES
jgi:putative peptidoglycan lipid II flippase